jgi:hypothetical protein
MQKVKLESLVRQFQENDDDFRRIKELVRQTVEESLRNKRYMLEIATLSVIESCRKDPAKFNILYHNLSSDGTSLELRPGEHNSEQYRFVFSPDEELYHKHNNANDIVYLKFLVDEAKQFFNGWIKELEQVCIDRLLDALTSTSISSHLAKRSPPDSTAVLPKQKYGNDKDDPLQ